MAGVENITNEILRDADENSAGIIKEAEDKKAKLIEEAKAEIEADSKKAQERTAAEKSNLLERAKSEAATNEKRAVLEARNEIITEVLDKAYDKLLNESDSEYFSMIYSLLEKNVHAEKGKMQISDKDMQRLPSDFKTKISEIASKKGGELVLSDAPADIDAGFVLSYGGIDENCSLKAIFNEKRTALSDIVYKRLWPKES